MTLRSMPHDVLNGPGRTVVTVNEQQEAAPTCHTPGAEERTRSVFFYAFHSIPQQHTTDG